MVGNLRWNFYFTKLRTWQILHGIKITDDLRRHLQVTPGIVLPGDPM
uniref:Uncharacterized protein n=1 Tax=Anguilla anguilla TaxID=7936 RepID=A0A0E9R389_ANGAN